MATSETVSKLRCVRITKKLVRIKFANDLKNAVNPENEHFSKYVIIFTAGIASASGEQSQSAPPVRGQARMPRGGGTVGGRGGSMAGSMSASTTPKISRQPLQPTARSQQQQSINNRIGEILSATNDPPTTLNRDNILDSSETFESVVPQLEAAEQAQQQVQQAVANAAAQGVAAATGTGNNGAPAEDVRVYVRCNYCDTFRSTLNSDTWEAILNHILPVAKEEIQTTFYGDLEKHFHRSVRIQVNGR